MTLINEFIEDYRGKIELYEQLAEICAQECEQSLKQRGLRALVTFRAKRIDSLINKVRNRAPDKAYQTIEDIYEDIVDLAGVRIALYFPGDHTEVDSFIHTAFTVDRVKDFPESQNRTPAYQKRFSGYVARHYRLRLPEELLGTRHQHLKTHIVEVQVGSVLMHAWAEIEHDLVYKSTENPLSKDEYAILDELNGLMHAGEIALERLQRAVKRRIYYEGQPFSNHYELSSFLYDYLRRHQVQLNRTPIERTDVLFEFLRRLELNSAPALQEILADCNLDCTSKCITHQIVDRILRTNSEFYKIYNEARLAVALLDPFLTKSETDSLRSLHANLNWFLQQWSIVEQLLRFNDELKAESADRLGEIKQLRNNILYTDQFPAESELIGAGLYLQRIAGQLRQEQTAKLKRNLHKQPQNGDKILQKRKV